MGKKIRKVKDPLAPKPPLNSYMLFAIEERARVLSDFGNLSTAEVGKEIGARWKNVSKEEKLKFEEVFRQNQERYRVEKSSYEKNACKSPSDLTLPAVSVKRNKKKKDPFAPKLPLTSYMEFVKEERHKVIADLGTLPLSEIGKELGRRWQKLSKEEKDPFEIKSRENRVEYEKKKESFDNKNPPSILEPPNQQLGQASQDLPSQETCLPSSSQSDKIELADLGFAQQKGFSWHPALKTGDLARGTRIVVTFFGTGQSGTVDKSKWCVYSEPAECRFSTPKLKKDLAFRNGLQQLKSLREKLLGDKDSPVSSSGITFTPQLGGRKFRKLNKDHLQKEEEENMRLMEKKMVQEEGSMLWTCRDCTWKAKYRLKAKAHARDCGQRQKKHIKKAKKMKFECSNGSCELTFPLLSQLQDHYRYY